MGGRGYKPGTTPAPPLQLIVPPRDRIQPNNDKDPLPYYYKPVTGTLYRRRLQMGLDMLPDGGNHILEVGVGSGILVPTLTHAFDHYTGVDLQLAPNLDSLVCPGCEADFKTADLLQPDSLPEAAFDAIVCFSVLEHIDDSDAAAQTLAQALSPGGTLVTGYPMVSPAMTAAFSAIGYKNIDEDHVATPAAISAALGRVLQPAGRRAMPPGATVATALYQCTA